MTDTVPVSEPNVSAAEYVLRLLDPAEEHAAAQRCRREPDFAQEVRFWSEHLGFLALDLPPVAPTRRTRRALLARIRPELRAPRFWSRATTWRGIALGSLLLAGATVLYDRSAPGAAPVYADLTRPETGLSAVAILNPSDHALRLVGVGLPPDRSTDYELWILADDGAPISLGLLPREARSAEIALPRGIGPGSGRLVLAVSAEPAGGSPTGFPTGPVVVRSDLAASRAAD